MEQQRALEIERNRIARDLHDDLGVGLTEIGLLGDLAGTNSELLQTGREHVQEMRPNAARTLAASLDEIVWAISQSGQRHLAIFGGLFLSVCTKTSRSRRGIRCRLEVVEPLPMSNLNAEERHEFFHAYKEALNNIIRHSDATQVQITMSAMENNLLIRIADDGCGLE